MIGRSDTNRREGQGGCREALSTKEVWNKGTTVGRRTGSEAAMRAMSVLGNAKSNCHRKTHRVEPDGAGRKFMHLTRGGLLRESAGEVSRGHSSEESRRKAEGAKGRRTDRRQSADGLSERWREATRNIAGATTTVATSEGDSPGGGGFRPRRESCVSESPLTRKEAAEDA
jgi:hypothetical protein